MAGSGGFSWFSRFFFSLENEVKVSLAHASITSDWGFAEKISLSIAKLHRTLISVKSMLIFCEFQGRWKLNVFTSTELRLPIDISEAQDRLCRISIYDHNETVIYAIDPCLNTFRPTPFPMFTFSNIYHTFISLCPVRTTHFYWFFAFLFIKKWKSKRIKSEKLFQQLQRAVSSPPEADCAKSERDAKGKAETSVPDPQKRFFFLQLPSRCELFILSSSPSFISIKLWRDKVFFQSAFTQRHIEWAHLAICEIGLGLKLNGLGSEDFRRENFVPVMILHKTNILWCNIKRAQGCDEHIFMST